MQPDDILTRDISLPTQARIQTEHFVGAGGVAYQALVTELAAARAEVAEWQRTAMAQHEQIAELKAKVAELTPKDGDAAAKTPAIEDPACHHPDEHPEPEQTPASASIKRPVGYVSPYGGNGTG